MKPKKLTGGILIVITLAAGIAIGNFISDSSFGRKLVLTPNNKINVILDVINQDYVDPVNMKDVTENAIQNIINELDPHSTYIPNTDLPSLNEDMDGHFGGIGVDYIIHNDTIVIKALTHGGPSSQAGLIPGDRIITVNHTHFTGPDLTEDHIIKTMRGPIGSTIHLGIRRPPADTITHYTIRRAAIPIPTIRAAYEVEKTIGYIKIYDKFSHTTHDEFIQAISQLTALGCQSFILDLRSNSGGAFEAAIKIINEFLPPGRMIVYAEGKSFPRTETLSDGTGNLLDNQLVILIDQLSASASEVVAGAIQDNDRGLIIGRRSFGKGLVQNQIDLSDGSAIRLTIARYYTLSGRNIQRRYEMGKPNDYNQDWLNQFNTTPPAHKDTTHTEETETYTTLHGRPVYGNNGIQPDIYLPIDTAHLSNYYIQLNNKNIFARFAFEYSDQNRTILNMYKDFPTMLTHLQTQITLDDIVRYAENHGIKKRTLQIRHSAEQILAATYAHIIGNFFGDSAFYQIYLNNDPLIRRACQAIHNHEATPAAIAATADQP
jgi:carboxyl-terminal processing protease